MAVSSRLRWTLTGLALVALAGAVLWGSLRDQAARDIPAEERPASTTPAGAVLEGRAGSELVDAERNDGGPDAPRATIRFVAPDGRAAAGAEVTYCADDVPERAFRGRADADGVLALAAKVVGKRCYVRVATGPSWAAGRFDVWAQGESAVRLDAGCRVWFELGPADSDRLGQVLRYGSSSGPTGVAGYMFDPRIGDFTATITSPRTFLGRFVGNFSVDKLGESRADVGLNTVSLPPSGEVTLRWAARPEPRVTAWLRVRGPQGSTAAPGVTVTGGGTGPSPWYSPARREERGAVVLGGAPGPVRLLAAADGQWAFRVLDASAGDQPADVDLPWVRGCSLEVRLPVEPRGEPVLSVSRLPGGELDRGRGRYDSYLRPGRIAFNDEGGAFPAGVWPRPARVRDATTRVWDGLPRGATVHVGVETERWGRLYATTTLPTEGEPAVLEVPPGVAFTVRGVADGPDPDVWLRVEPVGSPRGTERSSRTLGATAIVTGLEAGTRVLLQLRDARLGGEATVTVSDGLEVRIPLVRRPLARYRARVVDEEQRAVAGVGVYFRADPRLDIGTTVRTDADGWAEAVAPSDAEVYASTVDHGFTSQQQLVAPGEAVTLVARRLRSIQLTFDIGDQVVTVYEEHDHSMTVSAPRHVYPGSTYTLNALPEATRVHLRVTAGASGAGSVLFDEELELENVSTTLRVTR